MNPSQVSLFEPRLVKGVIGVSLNTQQNKPLIISFLSCKILHHSKCEQLTEDMSVSQSVSQSSVFSRIVINKCTLPQTTTNDWIWPSKIHRKPLHLVGGRENLKALICHSCCSTAISEKIPMDSLF